jgi:biotin synthase-related radical SAM superfamily protein
LLEKRPNHSSLPEQVRVSLGTAIVLGLTKGKLDAAPTTAYLMTHKIGKCTSNCGFCPQARKSQSKAELLSRVTWPSFPTPKVLVALEEGVKEEKIKRVCVQALNYSDVFIHLEALVREIKKFSAIPVSISCQPLNRENMVILANAGVERLGIAVDAATEAIFSKVKGKEVGNTYTWRSLFGQLTQALDVFGEGNVSTHIIVGLSETEKDVAEIIQKFVDMGILPSLFAFTPIRGTALEAKSPPNLESYRRIQLARYFIVNGKTKVADMRFNFDGKIIGYGLTNQELNAEVEGGLPFLTSGCPDCNRPYYNERPIGPIYNYPNKLSKKELKKIKKELS